MPWVSQHGYQLIRFPLRYVSRAKQYVITLVSHATTPLFYSFGGNVFLFIDDDRVVIGGVMLLLLLFVVTSGVSSTDVGDVCCVLLIVEVSTVLLRLPAKHNASLRICCCKSRRSRNKPEANMFRFVVFFFVNVESPFRGLILYVYL